MVAKTKKIKIKKKIEYRHSYTLYISVNSRNHNKSTICNIMHTIPNAFPLLVFFSALLELVLEQTQERMRIICKVDERKTEGFLTLFISLFLYIN